MTNNTDLIATARTITLSQAQHAALMTAQAREGAPLRAAGRRTMLSLHRLGLIDGYAKLTALGAAVRSFN